MSSSEDSETAEWEREQMLRGSQSRGRPQQRAEPTQPGPTSQPARGGEQKSSVIDAIQAKRHVKSDIDRVTSESETIKRNIGSTRVDIARAEKRIEAMKKYIEQLERANPFFEEIGKLKEPNDVIECLNRNRTLIASLPSDQKETLDLLESNMKEALMPAMEVDE